jgi:prolyl oligopeptidase
MYKKASLNATESSVFIDPNTLSEDGTTALSNYSFSEDGNYMAYTMSKAGSDWVSVKVHERSSVST